MVNWNQLEKYFAIPGTSINLTYENNALVNQTEKFSLPVENNYVNFLPDKKCSSGDSLSQLDYWESSMPNLRPPDHPVQTQFSEQRFNYLEQIIAFNQIQSAIDIGCGNGVGTVSLKKRVRDVIGLDMSGYLLKQMPNDIAAVRADATKLPLKDKSVDLSMAWELIHHIPHPENVFHEISRVTKKWVVIFEPNRWNPLQSSFSLLVSKERLGLRNTRSFLENYMKNAGLEVVHYATVGCIFPNKSPILMAKLFKLIPFKIPVIGISHLLIAKIK